MRKILCVALTVALALVACGCNKVLPTYAMPFAASWGADVRCSIPRVVAESALLEEAAPLLVQPPPVITTLPDGTQTTTVHPPAPEPVAYALTALDASGKELENVTVLIPKLMADALCNAFCAGSHGWKTVWDARVHGLHDCPILAIGAQAALDPVMAYIRPEPQFRANYFKAVHKVSKYRSKQCGTATNHVFGTDSDRADAAVACVMNSFTWWP